MTEVNDVPTAVHDGPYSGTVNVPVAFSASGSSDFDNDDGTPANNQTLTYNWDFGDGSSSSVANPVTTHTYSGIGTFPVTLTVYDGLVTSTLVQTEAVVADQGAITLTANIPNGRFRIQLGWIDAPGSNVDIRRDDGVNPIVVMTTANDGSYQDRDVTSAGVYTYKVCEETSSINCSNDVTVDHGVVQ